MLILILTPIEIEYLSVRKHLDVSTLKTIQTQGFIFEQGKFKGRHHTYDIVLLQTGSKNNNISLTTEKALHYFRPSIVILTGIAGGVKDVIIGDIVIADKIYGYESGKETKEGFVARPEVIYTSSDLFSFFQNIAKSKQWRKRSEISLEGRTRFGPIASGNMLVSSTDSSIFQRIKKHYEDSLVLEMEAIGFSKTMCHYPLIKFIVARGVSDLLNDKSKTDANGGQELAMENVSAFLFEALYELDYYKLNIPDNDMNTKMLVKSLYKKISSSIQKEAGLNVAASSNPYLKIILEKIKSSIKKEYKELIKNIQDEDNHAMFRIQLQRTLDENEQLAKELESLLNNINKSESANAVEIKNSKNVISGSSVHVGKDFHLGDKIQKGKFKNMDNESIDKKKKIELEIISPKEVESNTLVEEKIILQETLDEGGKEENTPVVEETNNEEVRHLEQIEILKSKIDDLSADFQSKLRYDSHKEKIIDDLHHELQKHKEGLILKLLRPVFMDVIEVIDDTNKMIRSLKEKNQLDNAGKILKTLENIPGDLEDLLYKHGVEVVETEEKGFDPSVQKILKVEVTKDESKNKAIAQKIKNGYQWEERLIRHEMVTVFKYMKGED